MTAPGGARGAERMRAAVEKRWPGGAPADPAEALRKARLHHGGFRGNASRVPGWLFDGYSMIRADLPGGRALVERLRRRGPPPGVDALVESGVGALSLLARGHGRWPVEPSSIFWDGVAVVARFRLPDGQPVADVNVDFFRTAAACVGGVDGVTWGGLSDLFGGQVVRLWRAGEPVAAIMGRADHGAALCPPVDEASIVCGGVDTPPSLHPPWPGAGASLGEGDVGDGEGGLGRVAATLGGRPISWGAFRWAVLTRVGCAWLGLDGGRALALFCQPLRALRAVDRFGVSVGWSGLVTAPSPGSLWSWFLEHDMAAAPEARPASVASARSPYGAPFTAELSEGGYRIFDASAGHFLRGRFADRRSAGRAAMRLTAARGLKGGLDL